MTPKYLNKILAPLQSQVSDKLSKYVQRDVADMDRIWWDIFVESWQRNRDYEALYDPPYPERGALRKYKHQEVCRPSGGRGGVGSTIIRKNPSGENPRSLHWRIFLFYGLNFLHVK